MKLRFATIFVIVFSMLSSFGCNKAKALTTVRDADELAAKMLIYARNIAKANNDSFEAHNIPSSVHLATNVAADKFLKGIDVLNQGIAAAKHAIETGASPTSQLDILEKIFDSEVVGAGLALVNLVTALPPALLDKVGGWAAAIQLAIVSFKGLFAELRMEVSPLVTA